MPPGPGGDPRSRRNRAGVVAGAALGLAVIAFWWPCLVGPMAPLLANAQAQMLPWRAEYGPPPSARWDALLWDGMAQYFPWRAFAARMARRGLIPLWNPHQFCGTPMLANGQCAFFYPPNWLFLVTGSRYALGLTAAVHYLLAGLFVMGLARELRLSPAAGLVGALAFAFGGFMVSWTHLPTLMNGATWLPATAWATERIFRRRRAADGVWLSLALAMAVLAGHLQIAAYVWAMAAVHVAARALWALRHRELRASVPALAAFPLAGGLALMQVLPVLELARLSPRGAVRPTQAGFDGMRRWALEPEGANWLWTLLSPDALGTPDEWSRAGLAYSEKCGYIGRLTLLLAVCALVGARSRVAWLFGTIGLAALWTARAGLPARVLYFHVPGMAQAGGFGRVLCVYTFSGALLAAIGADWLSGWVGNRVRAGGLPGRVAPWLGPTAALLVGVDVLVWAISFLPLGPRARVYPPSEVARRLAADAGRWRALAITERDDWTIYRCPEAVLPPNSATAYGYDSVQGYDSLLPKVYDRLAVEAEGPHIAPVTNGNMRLLENATAPVLEAASVKWIVTAASKAPPGPPLREVWRGAGVVLYESPDALPRPRLSAPGGAVHVEAAHDPARVTCTLDDCPGGTLVLADTYFPGWRAWVDGRSAPIRLHPPMFRGVRVGAGSAKVEMLYDPVSFVLGAFVALLSAAVLAGVIAARRALQE